jgi:hypothetical protein
MTAISKYNQEQCRLWAQDQALPSKNRVYSAIGLKAWSFKGKLRPADQKVVLLLKNTHFWSKLWHHFLVFLGWIKSYSPTLDALKDSVWTNQTLTCPPVRTLAKDLKNADAKNIENAADICLKTLEASESQIAQEQIAQLQKRLEAEWGVAKASEILANCALVPEKHTQPPSLLAKGRIDQICAIVRNYDQNQETLQKLKCELEQSVGASTAKKIMAKLNSPSYLNGTALISPKTIEEVRKTAEELKASQDADECLRKIEAACQTWLPGDEIIIKKHFNFDEAISKLPLEEQRQKARELKKIAIIAFLKKQLAQRAHLSTQGGRYFDISLLETCGHGIDREKLNDKDALHESIADYFQLELKKIQENCEALPSIDHLKKEIGLLPTIYRMSCASFTNLGQSSKFMHLRLFLWDKYQQEKVGQHELLPPSFPKERIPLLSRMEEESATYTLHRRIRNALFQGTKTYFLESYKRDDQNHFANRLRNDFDRLVQIDQKQLSDRLRAEIAKEKRIQFLTTYAPLIKQEFAQGYQLDPQGHLIDNPHSVLGGGVCWALCHRLEIASLLAPKKSFAQLDFTTIDSQDRFQQARHGLKFHFSARSAHLLDTSMLAKEGLLNSKEEEVLVCLLQKGESLDPFVSRFTTELSNQVKAQLAKSCGLCNIGLYFEDGGHSIALRADPAEHCYWLFDPNLGLIEIPYENGDDSAAYARLIIALEDLLKYYYGEKIKGIVVTQIKKEV